MINKKIYINEIVKDDLKNIEKWLNDEQFLKHYHYEVINKNRYKDIKKIYLNTDKKKYVPFAIRLEDCNEIVGLTEIFDISDKNKVAWVSVGIGDDKYRGYGYGKKAMELTIDHAFYNINLRKLQLTVIGYNKRAISLYENLGFIKEGIYRKAVLYNTMEYDLYLYGILKDEWK